MLTPFVLAAVLAASAQPGARLRTTQVGNAPDPRTPTLSLLAGWALEDGDSLRHVITEPTALVLGAGASMDFGFPSGGDLLRQVIRELGSPGSRLFQILKSRVVSFSKMQVPAEPVLGAFRTALSHARTPSIDLLVEGRPEFLDIGKAAIACGLIPCEKNTHLLFPADGSSWYDHLLGRLTDGTDGSLEGFRRNRLSIVTFNYDRSLEYFLFTALKYRWNLTDGDCADLVKAVPIVHVYGQLGKLPELNGGSGLRYGADLDGEVAGQSIAEMQILHEGGSSQTLVQAQELLRNARRICFLGFGYHPTNLERLRVAELDGNNKTVIGSAYGLEDGEKHLALKAFGPVRIELGAINDAARPFMRKSRILN